MGSNANDGADKGEKSKIDAAKKAEEMEKMSNAAPVKDSNADEWSGDKKVYSVAYEAQLPSGSYPGSSDARHFQEANKQLHETFQNDSVFAQQMEEQYPGIIKGVQPGKRGAYNRKAPTKDVTWHHEAKREGTMQLVPIEQHTAKGNIQTVLHPQGKGGMENWGGGRKRRK